MAAPCANAGLDVEHCPRVEEHVKKKWFVNRGISIDTLLTMAALAGGFVWWMANQEGRMVSHAEQIKHLEETDKTIMQKISTERMEMRDDIKEIKEQVYKLVERRR